MRVLSRPGRLKVEDSLYDNYTIRASRSRKRNAGKNLSERLGITHISTGDLLRLNVKENSKLGQKARQYMEKGELVPDGLVTDMLVERIKSNQNKNGFILDGYPRNLAQARLLDKILTPSQEKEYVIYLDSSEPIIIQRLSGRRICSVCGSNFHIKNMPPKIDMICDSCGGSLIQRSDDEEITIRNRLKVYLNEISSLIDYYNKRSKLYKISADEEAETVLEKIVSLVSSQ